MAGVLKKNQSKSKSSEDQSCKIWMEGRKSPVTSIEKPCSSEDVAGRHHLMTFSVLGVMEDDVSITVTVPECSTSLAAPAR